MTLPIFGRYSAIRLLGKGGMASVYEAVDELLERHVAIKIIHPHLAEEANFEKRFRQEAKLVASLRHPHIIHLYNFEIQNGQPFMVMEYLAGGTLKDKLDDLRSRGKSFELGEVNQIVRTLSGALYYAHEHGAVHRDIKPANVLFTEQNEPVITDFGIAKLLHESAQINMTGGVIGTPAYMSPEQASGVPVNSQSDQYSLAIMVYELITGRVPFTGESAATILMQHLTKAPPAPRSFNPNLPLLAERVILRGLEKDPNDRYPTVLDFAQALDTALHGEDRSSRPAAATDQTIQNTHSESNPMIETDLSSAVGVDRRVVLPITVPVPSRLQKEASVTAVMPAKKPRIPRWAGFGAGILALVVILLFFSFGGMSLIAAPPVSKPTGYLVAIADFDSANASKKIDFSRRIFEEIQNETSSVTDKISVVQTHTTFANSQDARAAGQKMNAALLIWGWYDDLGVSPHIEMIQQPVSSSQAIQRNQFFTITNANSSSAQTSSSALDLSSFYNYLHVPRLLSDMPLFVSNGPQQLAYISESILGLAFQSRGEYQTALDLYNKALNNIPTRPASTTQPGSQFAPGEERVYFQRGMVFAQLSRYPEAVKDLKLALTLNPKFYEAYYNLGIIYPEVCQPSRQMDAALQAAKAAVQIQPDQAGAHRLLAEIYYQLNQYSQALDEAQAAGKLDVQEPLTYLLEHEIYTAQGKTAQALEASQKGFQLLQTQTSAKPASGLDDFIALGDAALQANLLDDAQRYYQQAAALSKDSPDVQRALGNLSVKSGNFAQAAKEYEAWVKLEPQNAAASNSLGFAYLRAGNKDQAAQVLNNALTLTTCNADTYSLIGSMFMEQQQYAKAEQAFSQTVKVDPDRARSFYYLGVAQYLETNYQQAADNLDKSLQIDPGLVIAMYARGTVSYLMGSYQQALDEWSKVAAALPDDFQTAVDVGNAYEKLKETDQAISAYQKALGMKEDADVRTYLGMVYLEKNQIPQAIEQFRKALVTNPNSSLAENNLGDALQGIGDLASARDEYLKSLAIQDDAFMRLQLAIIYTRLGQVPLAIEQLEKGQSAGTGSTLTLIDSQLAGLYSRIGRLDDAEKQYLALLQTDPKRADAYADLGALAYKRCDLSSMSKNYSQAATLGSKFPYFADLPASAFAAQGFPSQQAQVITNTLNNFPNDPVALIWNGEYLIGAGRLPVAEISLQKALQTPNLSLAFQSIAHGDLGSLNVMEGNLSAAQGEFSLSIQAYPSNAYTLILIGDLALRNGRPQEALQTYEKALSILPEYGYQLSGDNAELFVPALAARRAIALTQLGKNDEAATAAALAISQAKDILGRMPNWPQAHFMLGYVYYSQADKTSAEGEFSAALACDASLKKVITRTKADLDLFLGLPKK